VESSVAAIRHKTSSPAIDTLSNACDRLRAAVPDELSQPSELQGAESQESTAAPLSGDRAPRRRGDWIVFTPCLVLALFYVAVFLWLCAARIGHPFELEWMEGGSLRHMLRVLMGEPLYPAPSLDFVPFPYPPLYYYAAAALTPFLGPHFTALRLVSCLSAVGCLLLVSALVRHETRSMPLALTSAGLFAATYRASGVYLDVGRIDSFFLLLVLGSVYLLRTRRDAPGFCLAGFVAFLSIFTKQTGLALLAPLLLWCAFRDWRLHGADLLRWRRLPCFGLAALIPLALATGWLEAGENGHFLFYVLGAQRAHEIRPEKISGFFAGDLFAVLPVAILLGFGALAVTRWKGRESGLLFYVAFGLGTAAACIVPRVKVGGALNNLIPIYAYLCVIGGIASGRLLDASEARGAALRRWLPVALSAALAGQLVWLHYDPRIALPPESDRAAGRRLIARLEGMAGEVLLPAQGYLAGMAGKRVFAHQMPVDDLSRSGLPEAEALRDDFRRAIDEQRFAIIIDSTSRFLQSYPDDDVLKRRYRLLGPVFEEDGTLTPLSGWRVGPGEVWVPIAGRGAAANH
jgi:hypothetical protein